jgi:hypothetical protein
MADPDWMSAPIVSQGAQPGQGARPAWMAAPMVNQQQTQQQTPQSPASAQTAARPGPWNQTERMLLGFATPAVGIMQGTADVAGRLGIIGKDRQQGYDDAAAALQGAKGRLRQQAGLAPGAFDVHDTVGEAINPLNYAVRGAGLLKGAGMGAATGAMQPTTSDSPIFERAKNAAEGAATATGLGALFHALGPARQAILNTLTPAGAADRAQAQAVAKVLQRFSDDEKGGGPSATEAIAAVNAARARGTPMALADAGGKNVQGLAGSLSRKPGPPKSIAEEQAKNQMREAGARLTQIGAAHISSGPSMRQSVKALTAAQKAAAAPLYEKAMAPGSVAPLEKQFEGVFRDTSKAESEARKDLQKAQNAMTVAAAKVSRAGDNVYMASAALKEQAQARTALQEAQQKAQAAVQAKQAVLARLREAQSAAAAGQRGGVWSPYIQQIISDPIMKPAIARGLEVQRIEALADRKPFNPRDYAITGYDKSGEPIVDRVPNMRLLDSIKKGMDKIIEDFRDPLTGKLDFMNGGDRGQIAQNLNTIRRDFLDQIDEINPVYKEARAAWAGPAKAAGLVLQGRNIFRMHPEEVQEVWNPLSPAEREHFKLGVADWWRDEISKAGPKSPSARGLDKNDFNDMIKERLRPLFSSQKKFDDFIQAVTDERTVFVQAGKRLGGSQTAERQAEDAELGMGAAANATKGLVKAAGGNYFGAVGDFLKAKRDLGIIGDKKVNEAMARLLFDPTVNLDTQRGRTLLSMVPSPKARAYIENFRRAGTLATNSRQGEQESDQPQDASALN